MKRWAFNLAAIVSALLCVALIAAAIRSAVVGDTFYWEDAKVSNSMVVQGIDIDIVSFYSGCFAYEFSRNQVQTGTWGLVAVAVNPHATWKVQNLWREWLVPYFVSSNSGWAIRIPYWIPITLTLLLPLVWLRRFRRDRKASRMGLCPTCGYDLRATPERCPECGAIPNIVKAG